MKRYAKINSSQMVFLLISDAFIINLSSFLALLFRFDLALLRIPASYLEAIYCYALIHTVITIGSFFFFRLYTAIWKFAGVDECINILLACITSSVTQVIGMYVLGLIVPRSYYIINICVLIILELMLRLSNRVFRTFYVEKHFTNINQKTNVMVIGAGCAGSIIIREIKTTEQLNKQVVCIIDDDSNKKGKYLCSCLIAGDRATILKNAVNYEVQDIIVAIPSASHIQIKEILKICNTTGCQVMILPGVYQLINGEFNISKLRSVNIEDLLGREQVEVDLAKIMDYVSGKVVLVTGGGGSIGSELCRQIAT